MTMTETTEQYTEQHTEQHTITLAKDAQRTLQTKSFDSHARNLLASVNTRQLAARGWSVELQMNENTHRAWRQRSVSRGEANYRYEMFLQVNFSGTRTPEARELQSIVVTIAKRCEAPAYGRWTLAEVDNEAYEPKSERERMEGSGDPELGYAPVHIPEDWKEHYSHLYGLDDEILRMIRALEGSMLYEWEKRFNVVLEGPPGCGKSDICKSLKRMLPPGAVLEFDATAMTAAGAIKELTERDVLPRVIIVEEAEKADGRALDFLLSVLDLRSEIRKTTARGTIERDTKLWCVATVNDTELFRSIRSGALASRFTEKVRFQRPSRETLQQILVREITQTGGNLDWIKPTLDYCEEAGIDDPRQVISICMCGRDMLLNGEYQRMLKRTSAPVEKAVA